MRVCMCVCLHYQSLYEKKTVAPFVIITSIMHNFISSHCLKRGRWQGPPHIKQSKTEILLYFQVSLFIQSIES